jgi:hypothetical protein
MTEKNALSKNACPECGADLAWNPSKQSLVCPYCGTSVPGKPATDGSGIVEHDLAEALRSAPDERRGWQEEKISVKCQSCQAITLFTPGRVAQSCDFCGSPAIIPYEETKEAIRPESVLPFKIDTSRVRDDIRKWYGSRWFAPNRLKNGALTDTLKGIYLPYWTFDAQADAQWTAESGYHYYVAENYTRSDGRTETRRVQKTRWEPSHGQLHHFFDDQLVPGTTGVHPELLSQIEPFPTNELLPYDPSYIRSWIVERYQVDLGQAAERSRQQMDGELRDLCARQVPGDTHRNLQVQATYSDRTFKHILLPIWLVSYLFGTKSFQVLVNGYTGKITGERPYSWIKITLAVLLVVFILLVGLLLKSTQ